MRTILEQETMRYLGVHGRAAADQPDDQTINLIRECFHELDQAATPRYICREFPLTVEGSRISLPGLVTDSLNLSKNLADCDEVLLFAATLGSRVDMLLKRYGTLQMSKAVVMQAAATAKLEAYCNDCNQELIRQYRENGRYLRPRFSPGYGDFPLACQREIAAALELSKRLGITLTDSLLMLPTKSVTAVIGISRQPADCAVSGCEACAKTSCAYRRS